jgi:hypothetical protein
LTLLGRVDILRYMETCIICNNILDRGQSKLCSRKCTARYANQKKQLKYSSTISKRFWARTIPSNECIRWLGAITSAGYGCVRINKQTYQAHRVAYELEKGEIPSNMYVIHTCDNRWCVNPEHLFIGTHQDNMTDKIRKGRQPQHHGENNPRARLTQKDIKEIRELYHSGNWKQKDIGLLFGIHQTHVSRIITWGVWK